MARIQIKTYRKRYLTEKKGSYLCKSYYVYLPKRLAEPLVGKDLRLVQKETGLLLELIDC